MPVIGVPFSVGVAVIYLSEEVKRLHQYCRFPMEYFSGYKPRKSLDVGFWELNILSKYNYSIATMESISIKQQRPSA